MDEEEVHIAVGKNFRKEKANILWAAASFPRATIVLVHVHWPSKWMPFMGGKVLYKFADEKEKEVHRSRELEAMIQMLSEYKSLCGARKVRAHYLTHDNIIAGVVNLIKKLKITRIVIGSRSMSRQEVVRQACQVWVVLNGKHISTSNDHLHTGSIGYGGSSDILASIRELCDESSDYITPPSEFVDEITDVEVVNETDDPDQSIMEAETLTEESTDESTTYEEEEISGEEGADQSDEIQSFRNVTERAEKIMAKIDRLQKKLKILQGESHNHGESRFSPRQMAASLEKTFSQPRYPELQITNNIAQFSMSQLEKATDNFHSRNFIGEGGYGRVYKGVLGGQPVAIKLLRPQSTQGFPEFQQEMVILSRLEHPHIVRLLGVCPESCSLVYEHLPHGTLRDRLSTGRGGLLWKELVGILAEQRSALAHLHTSRPHAIIHADVKLSNVLLDAGDASRLGDFGTARAVHVKPLAEEETIGRRTGPMGTTGYMDPIFFMTGELTTESDVYAFGVVVMQLLTGLLDLNVADQVREAIRMDAVHGVLDASAGAWPEVQAERLLKLALRCCCSLDRKRRPAITSDAEWRPLDILRAMATPASKSRKWNCHAS